MHQIQCVIYAKSIDRDNEHYFMNVKLNKLCMQNRWMHLAAQLLVLLTTKSKLQLNNAI